MAEIHRYTELPFALHLLMKRKLTLLSPRSWDDKNDAHFVECYRKVKGHSSLLALCLTEAPQTYHHWKVFTAGASGARVTFNKELFLDWVANNPELSGKPVKYRTVAQLRDEPPNPDDLPFLKRAAYKHEKEYRLLHSSNANTLVKEFDIPLDTVDSIVLNPWMPKSTARSVRDLIHMIPGCETLRVIHATIIENTEWRELADELLVL